MRKIIKLRYGVAVNSTPPQILAIDLSPKDKLFTLEEAKKYATQMRFRGNQATVFLYAV